MSATATIWQELFFSPMAAKEAASELPRPPTPITPIVIRSLAPITRPLERALELLAPFGEAGDRFCSALRRFAAANGAPGKFHETITWAYLTLINERQAATPVDDFASFASAHPDLLDNRTGALSRLYDSETLASELARRVFVGKGRGRTAR